MADVLSAVPDGQRLSDWIEQAPIGRTATYALLQALAIEPGKARLQGVARPVAMLTTEQITQLDAAVDRLQQGESISQLAGEPAASAIIHEHSRMLTPAGLEVALESLASALQALAAPVAPAGLETALESLAGALQALAPPVIPTPLARARALRDAAAEGLLLTTDELAQITGLPLAELEVRRSGDRLQGYRLKKVGKKPGLVWRLEALADPVREQP